MFIRYISNGIRNPLNTALLGLKLLQDDMLRMRDSPERIETVHNIRQSCNHATTILDDLLTYDKLESGITEPEMKPMRAWGFIRDCVRPFLTKVWY